MMIGRKEAAAILGVSPMTLYFYFRRGIFKTATKIRGTVWQVEREEIEKALRENWSFRNEKN